ncbi:ABC transporter substrate-binding protein [Salipiger thiooxidans]|uniref:ABC transporter substrate-binding protein n=1 Tax=Salipiger thiooxidans TaxID=282683 RepID=UPI001CD2845E|nr:ABC transporter substrate-binding protein [Salipiger thiooxidans]MCA0851326.1 ABC transporter substrate-binding protein [Salipiger thiooxidans]
MKYPTKMAVTVALALASATALSAAEDPIVIGVASGQTGTLAPWDLGAARGAELAVEDINANGGLLGRPVELVIRDTKSDPSLGPTAALEVLDQGAEMVMVACDYDFGAPAALAAISSGKIAMASCAADAKFGVQGVGPLAYTMALATNGQGALLAEFASEQEGWDNVYIMQDTAIEYTKSLCANFRQRWVDLKGADSIVGEDTWNGLNDNAISGQISRMKADGADADFVMWCGFTNNGSMMRQLRSAGVGMPILASESMDGSHWIEAVPDLSDFYIAVYASIWGNDPEPRISDFMTRYEEKFGEPAQMGHVVTGYNAVEAWSRAVEKAGSLDTAAIKEELDGFTDEPLLTGGATFTPELHINLTSPMLIMKATDGSFEPIGRRAAEKVYPPQF